MWAFRENKAPDINCVAFGGLFVLLCGNARRNGTDILREKRGANITLKMRRDKTLFISYTFHYILNSEV